MNQIYVFDTKTNTWGMKQISGNVVPSTRTSHSAIVSKCVTNWQKSRIY